MNHRKELQKQKSYCGAKCKELMDKIRFHRETLRNLTDEHADFKMQYESADRELFEMDQAERNFNALVENLTQDQINQLLQKIKGGSND